MFKVVGYSMWPTLRPRDRLLCYKSHRIGLGSVIVFEASGLGLVVKRVSEIHADYFRVTGDNSEAHSPLYELKFERSGKCWVVFLGFSISKRGFFIPREKVHREVSNT